MLRISRHRLLLDIIFYSVLVYAALLLALYAFQRALIYHPHSAMEAPAAYGLSHFSQAQLTAADGVRLTAWTHPPRQGFPWIVYFHGNAGNLSHRAGKFEALAHAGFGVLALSYRGFGASEGAPSERGIYEDARATINYALHTLHAPLSRIVLFGESLGSGVAVQMATEQRVAGLALEAPYTSVADRAGEMYPFAPVRLMLKDRFDSITKIAAVHAPLLIFHGAKDRLIPIRHGKALLAAANDPKEMVIFDNVAHNDFDATLLATHLAAFARKHGITE